MGRIDLKKYSDLQSQLGIDRGFYASADKSNGVLAKAGHGIGVSYGFKDAPLVSLEDAGATAGVHAAEARAGPFAVRAGVKFGMGMRHGVPEMDLGPVTFPCCIQ